MLIKICGITNPEDARYCLDRGADWIGFNMVAGPRRIDKTSAELILRTMSDPARAVALIRTSNAGHWRDIVQSLHRRGLRRFQLYGDAIPESVKALAALGLESILVQPVADRSSFDSLDKLLRACHPDRPTYLLLDAAVAGKLGGTGKTIDSVPVDEALNRGRSKHWPPWLLAGGLTPANIVMMIDRFRPAGVDVCSGVESAPGKKDRRKVSELIQAVRS